MSKQLLGPDQLINELNRQLREDEAYQVGMNFIPSPEGASGKGMSGYSAVDRFDHAPIYARVAHKVFRDFALKV